MSDIAPVAEDRMFICGGDYPWDEIDTEEAPTEEALAAEADAAIEARPELTWEIFRALLDRFSDMRGDWQGIPVTVPGFRVILNKHHPLREKWAWMEGHDPDPEVRFCTAAEVEEPPYILVNEWVDRRRNRTVCVVRQAGRPRALVLRHAPDRSMERLTMWLTTLGASDAWSPEAEAKAREKLRSLLNERQWNHYDLTGAFMEHSPRSNLHYLFRRLRPTVVMSPRWRDTPPDDDKPIRAIACLCMHPVGYYAETWAGCMTPTDDVIAHLLAMRGAEADYWRQANQHDPADPEAGL